MPKPAADWQIGLLIAFMYSMWGSRPLHFVDANQTSVGTGQARSLRPPASYFFTAAAPVLSLFFEEDFLVPFLLLFFTAGFDAAVELDA